MSQSIWTQCEARFSSRPLSSRPWRVVEAQHVKSTRRLVDSDEDQEVLERLIDSSKPPWPKNVVDAKLHYLLSTPFRHPPLHHGSRFGTRLEGGIWYGAESQHTAFAEKAYYFLLFLEGTSASLGLVTQPLTVFQSHVEAARGADLTHPPFDEYESQICSPTTYRDSQPLGTSLRAAGIESFRFISARDSDRGTNLGLFEPVFLEKQPMDEQSWVCTGMTARVEFKPTVERSDRVRVSFVRTEFEVDGTLPAPGVA